MKAALMALQKVAPKAASRDFATAENSDVSKAGRMAALLADHWDDALVAWMAGHSAASTAVRLESKTVAYLAVQTVASKDMNLVDMSAAE